MWLIRLTSPLRKLAPTVWLLFRVMVQVEALPLQAPLQLSRPEPPPGVEVSVILVPCLKVAWQPVGQLMPLGSLVTVPEPGPDTVTVRVAVCGGVGGGVQPPLPELPFAAWQLVKTASSRKRKQV